MDCSTPGFPVLNHLPEFAQTHYHWVSDAIQPSHPLSPTSPLALSLSQHQGLFQWVGSSLWVAKVLELQHQFSQWIFRFDCLLSKGPSGVFSSTTVQKHHFFSAQPSLWSLTFIHDYWKNHSFDYMNLCLQSDVSAICCYSVAQSYLPLWDPIDYSTPDFPVLPHLLEFVQTHVHWVDDAIQSSCPLSFLSPSALFFPWHQGLFQWVSSSHQVAKVLELQLQHQSFQWIFRVYFF